MLKAVRSSGGKGEFNSALAKSSNNNGKTNPLARNFSGLTSASVVRFATIVGKTKITKMVCVVGKVSQCSRRHLARSSLIAACSSPAAVVASYTRFGNTLLYSGPNFLRNTGSS